MADMNKAFFIVIRAHADPSGVGQFVGAFADEAAAEEEVTLQSQYNPETSGLYYIAEFEAQQAGALVAISGALQYQIDNISASGITGPQGPPGPAYDDSALSGWLQGQINQNSSNIATASGALHEATLQSSGWLQGQINQNSANLATASGVLHEQNLQASGYLQEQIEQNYQALVVASGNLYETTIEASGHLQQGINQNTAFINASSGYLQGEIDLARFQVLMTFGSAGTPSFTSSSSSYELVAIFEYPGSDHIVNPPTDLVVYASVNQANKSGAIRLYDVTNDVTVGETTFIGNTNIEQQVVALSGLPPESATFELQIKTVSGGGSVSVYTATMI